MQTMLSGRQTPHQSQKNDPFKQEEGDNDATRIRPGVNEPQKNDPTKIDNPTPPTIPTPPITPGPGPDPSEPPGQTNYIK